MSKPKLSIEDANVIAAAIIAHAQQPSHFVNHIEIEIPTESLSMPKKRGRPAKMKTAEEIGGDAEAEEYSLDFANNWSDRARHSRWSDDM